MGRRSIVILACRHVAAAAAGVDLENSGSSVLPLLPRQAHEVSRYAALSVVAHRMRGVDVQSGQRLCFVPKTKGAQERIDEARFRSVGGGIAARAGPSEGHGTVRPQK